MVDENTKDTTHQLDVEFSNINNFSIGFTTNIELCINKFIIDFFFNYLVFPPSIPCLILLLKLYIFSYFYR